MKPTTPIATAAIWDLPSLEFIPRASPHLTSPTHFQPFLDAFDLGETEGGQRVVFSAPCQHGKTQTALHAVVRRMLRNRRRRVIYATYAQQYSSALSREMRTLFTSCGGTLSSDFNTIQEWHTDEDGYLLATSPDGAATGKSADDFVIDDPFKNREEAENAEERDRRWNWFRSVALTRQGPKSNYYVIASRFHDDDLSGRLIKAGWKHVRLPAINDGADERREIGAALCAWGPDSESPRDLPFLEKLRAEIGEYDWASLYQGTPRPREGSLFKDAILVEPSDVPKIAKVVIGVDLAYSAGARSDWTAVVVLGLGADGKVYVLQTSRWQKPIAEYAGILRAIMASHGEDRAYTYISGNERGHLETLARESPPIEIVGMPARFSKFFRAQGTSKAWNAGDIRVMRTETSNELVSEVTAFSGGPGDAHDDQVDAMVSAYDVIAGDLLRGEKLQFAFGMRRV